MALHQHSLFARQAGVSLVEALMALAVMAFGMLALVGVQTTMRLNNDLSKQRSEATRIATEHMECLRMFTAVDTVPGAAPCQAGWDDLANLIIDPYVPPGGIGNATYRVVRTVNLVAGTPQRVVRVQVQWTDRTGSVQTVTLDSTIVGAAPLLSSLLSVPPQPSPTNQIEGRDPTIPREAVDLGDGRSAYKPFDSGTVVWVFNNLTGEVVSRCTGVAAAQAAIVAGDLNQCAAVVGRTIAGHVAFDLLGGSPKHPKGYSLPLNGSTPLKFAATATSPVNQSQDAECVADGRGPQHDQEDGSADSAYAPATWVRAYFCVVFPGNATGWGGKLDVIAAGTFPGNGHVINKRGYQVCRFTKANADFTVNTDHPLSYCVEKAGAPTADVPCIGNKVTTNLVNQNFLIVNAGINCPVDNAATATSNASTRLHQSSPE